MMSLPTHPFLYWVGQNTTSIDVPYLPYGYSSPHLGLTVKSIHESEVKYALNLA